MKKVHDILVLNKSYVPISIVSWQDGISLIYTEKCRPLDRDFLMYSYNDWIEFSKSNADTYQKVHTVNYPLAVPEIIVLFSAPRLNERQIKYSRQNIFVRDGCRCGYCGKKHDRRHLTIDHIIPQSAGGKTTWDNIISCCRPCNQIKGSHLLGECGLKLRFKPHKPKWQSPLDKVDIRIHPCKSWAHFMHRVQTEE